MGTQRIRVLIVDDSTLVRSILTAALARHRDIQIVGQAVDGIDALRKIAALRPDVVTLDIEMPNMNGLTVLERVVGKAPVGFVMVSTLTQTGARITFEALNKGAFDYVAKPANGRLSGTPEFKERLYEKVVGAARTKGKTGSRKRTTSPVQSSVAPALPPNQAKGWVVAIGISCGGPPTLTDMLPMFPSDFVPIVITQHMPAKFTKSFAGHLDAVSSLKVQEAQHLQPLAPGNVYLAPGGKHLRLIRDGVNLQVSLAEGEKVSGHRPSVDVMFQSVAQACGRRSIGVIMTGMGSDGAAGMVKLKAAGAKTIAQDRDSCLIYGMPKVAVESGAVDYVVPMQKIPAAIAKLMRQAPAEPVPA